MPESLTDEFISDQYTTLLHLSAQTLTATEVAGVYDGVGNQTALGLSPSGASITGRLSSDLLKVAGIDYPEVDGSAYDIAATNGAGKISLYSISNLLSGLGGFITPGTYRNVTITVNSNGVISEIQGNIAIRTYYYSLGIPSGLTFDLLETPGEPGAPNNSKVLQFLQSVWGDAGVGDLANVVSFIRNATSIKTISTRDWAPDTVVYVYEAEYTESGWAINRVRQTSSGSFE